MGPKTDGIIKPPKTLYEAVKEPWSEFFARKGAVVILVFIILYKLGDAFAASLTTAFLISGGFSLSDIGIVSKGMGLGATILGALVGGTWMTYMGL